MARRSAIPALVRACHPAPVGAVTLLTLLLAIAAGHSAPSGGLVTLAVFTGQLTIGWSNDLVDVGRDRQVNRTDKPLASNEFSEQVVRRSLGAAAVVCVVLSLAGGLASGLVHLLLVVGSGWAYNLGLKRTWGSAVPYALAFGSLPSVVTLALGHPQLAEPWMTAAGAMLGVGAHLLNVLPDLADDAATGVQGLPHRLGARRVRVIAPGILLGASAAAVVGPGGSVPLWGWGALGASVLLAGVATVSHGRLPFFAAIGIAALDVAALVVGS